MADLSDINSAGSTKIIGSDLTGVETTPMAVNSDGSINVAVTSVIETEIKNDSGNPIPISSSDLTATGTITAINQNVAISTIGKSVVDIQVTGTYTGALTPQITVDGTNWIALSTIRNINTNAIPATVVSATQGIFQAEISAATQFRIIALAAVTGTATITMRASLAKGPGSSIPIAIVAQTLPLPTGASTSALQTTGNTSLATIVTNTTGIATSALQTTGNTSLSTIVTNTNGMSVAQGSTTASQVGGLVQGAVTTAAPTYTTGQTNPLSLSTAGALRVDGSGVTQPISGTVTANQGTSPWVVSGSTTITGSLPGFNTDAFGRLRVSEGFTLGDYKHTYGIDPNFRDTLANGGTITHVANQACVRLNTSSNSASSAIHQTKQYHNYMPGKSQLIKTTINFYSAIANVTKRTGYFDDLNGIFFEQAGDGTLSFVIRTNTSGSPTDARKVSQAQWNVDTCSTSIAGTSTDGSNFGKVGSWTLDITKTQIFFIDFQWLGVGRVRCGFVHNGQNIVAHEFYNSNNLPQVYMANPNLPVRCEIRNTGATTGGYFDQICSTVISEGGYIESGIDWSTDSGGTAQSVPTTDYYPVIAIRLKNSFKGYPNRVMVRTGNINVYAERNPVHWQLVKLPNLASMTLSSPTWTSADAESAVEYTILGTAFTNGDAQDGGFVGTSSPGGSAKGTGTSAPNAASNAKKNFIAQNQDSSDSEIYVVVCRAINAAADVWVSVQWREVY